MLLVRNTNNSGFTVPDAAKPNIWNSTARHFGYKR